MLKLLGYTGYNSTLSDELGHSVFPMFLQVQRADRDG